ncbi:hypothetical protein [Pyxidicoccus caerfyrddinensis]|uniref:hypothetical protein n=1 Tax=Pyxidicoccus caerfyrddinensis TaxID=2709663 RepID=UPI0013DD5AAE|nr:hypothetical protein [Pyxidicoccus caerfyrddinensis]
MSDSVDAVTRLMTGNLTLTLLLAAVLTWPISVGLLALYRRAVRNSMARQTHVTNTPPTQPAPEPPPGELPAPASALVNLNDRSSKPAHANAEHLLRRLLVEPWRVAAVYTAAACVYALILALAEIASLGLEVLPLRLTMLFWLNLWPLVLTIGVVAASVRSAKAVTTAVYFTVLMVLGMLSLQRSPDLTWRQIATLWALINLPTTLVLLTYLSRRVRAVGPLVLSFLFVAVLGSAVAMSLAMSTRFFKPTFAAGERVGLEVRSTIIALLVIGFTVFALFGGLVLAVLRRRYEARRLSDESLTLGSIWLLFTATYSINIAFSHPAWVLAGVVALAAFHACVRIGFSGLVGGTPLEKSSRLLLLRSFSIGRDSVRLFDALQKHWRRVGSIQLIAGTDLAKTTVEPHEFLDFISGKLSRRFIDGPRTLERRMTEMDTAPDRDGRFQVNDFFCYDDTWKMVLSRLVKDSDVVLMDLRGFSPRNAGCIFEIRELVNLVPLQRVVFLIDDRTDEPYLRSVMSDSALAIGPASPNRAAPAFQAGTFRFASMSLRELRQLLRTLAAAARAQPIQAQAGSPGVG